MRIPDREMKKKMLAEALKVAVNIIMKNHIYQFDGKIHKQARGGPIGLDLTGDLAAIFMSWWDKEFIKRLKEQGIEILFYKRYVDDITIILRAPDKRLRYVKEDGQPGRLILGEEASKEPKDIHAMELLRLLGNDIHDSIQLETDCSSMHEDNKLPILDVKMWIEKGIHDINVILHEYYQKEVSSKSVIDARSSLPWSAKRTILTQEVLRVLLRCSTELPWETVKSHVETYMMRMQYSGYNKRFKGEIVRSAFKAYRELRRKDNRHIATIPTEGMEKESKTKC